MRAFASSAHSAKRASAEQHRRHALCKQKDERAAADTRKVVVRHALAFTACRQLLSQTQSIREAHCKSDSEIFEFDLCGAMSDDRDSAPLLHERKQHGAGDERAIRIAHHGSCASCCSSSWPLWDWPLIRAA